MPSHEHRGAKPDTTSLNNASSDCTIDEASDRLQTPTSDSSEKEARADNNDSAEILVPSSLIYIPDWIKDSTNPPMEITEATLGAKKSADTLESLQAASHTLNTRYHQSKSLDDIDTAICHDTRALRLFPSIRTNQLEWLDKLGTAYSDRFENTGLGRDARKSIEYHELAVSITPDESSNKLARLHKLGIAHRMIFIRLGAGENIKKAVEYFDRTVSLAPDHHPDKPRYLNEQGIAYNMLFEQVGGVEHVHTAISCFEEALSLTPDGHSDKPARLSNLGVAHRLLFDDLGVLDDIKKSIGYLELALSLSSDSANKITCLANLGGAYEALFDQIHQKEYIHKAIDCKEQVVALAPESYPNRHQLLSNLGSAYVTSSDRLGIDENLDKGVTCFEHALSLIPEGHVDQSMCLNNLGFAYQLLFERRGSLEHLKKAAGCMDRAISLVPDDHSSKRSKLRGLGNTHKLLFQRLGSPEHIRLAVNYLEQAVLATPDGHPYKPASINDLGSAYQIMYERLGILEHIDKAFEYLEQAVSLTPDGHYAKPGYLSNIGNAYRLLFIRLGGLQHLEKSIEYLEQAVLLAPIDHPVRAACLTNLGSGYKRLFERSNAPEDIKRALDYFKQAVLLTPDNHPDKPSVLNNLATTHQALFKHTGEQEHIDIAINYLEDAIALTPDGHLDKPAHLSSLGNVLRLLFEDSGVQAHIEKAVDCQEQAVLLTPDGHANKSSRLINLGNTLWIRYQRSDKRSDGEASLKPFRTAAVSASGHPSVRLLASRRWAQVSQTLRIPTLDAYSCSMMVLPQVVWLGSSVRSRYESISTELQTLITEAAAAAVEEQRYDLAVEWLEQGRCLVWSQLLQLRTPLEDLHAAHPEVADELKSLSYSLESASTTEPIDRNSCGDKQSLQEAARSHRRWAERREKLIESIRLLPGYSSFLKPPSFPELVARVRDGCVVLLNIAPSRCDALIIQAGANHADHVQLPGFTYQKAQRARTQLTSCLQGQNSQRGVKKDLGRSKASFKALLAVLWHEIAKPVVDCLNIGGDISPDDLPHITWCVTGPLSSQPMHAAGDYTSPRTVLSNLAISSYAPNLSSLGNTVSNTSSCSGILAVGHESPIPDRGLSKLPGTKAELDRVEQQFREYRITRLDEEHASTGTILDAMGRHDWVHFACHASQNPLNPLKSALHLHDGDLDLATIYRTPMKNAQLAFLSACQTATGDSALPDEAVHLAAGLLMAGYPHVIASMWSINDADAPIVAGKFYEYLQVDGKPDSRKAAKALHKAIASLRDVIGVEEFARWAPYIHVGN